MRKIEIYYQLVVVPPIVTNITMHNSFLLVWFSLTILCMMLLMSDGYYWICRYLPDGNRIS